MAVQIEEKGAELAHLFGFASFAGEAVVRDVAWAELAERDGAKLRLLVRGFAPCAVFAGGKQVIAVAVVVREDAEKGFPLAFLALQGLAMQTTHRHVTHLSGRKKVHFNHPERTGNFCMSIVKRGLLTCIFIARKQLE